jgi:hypothetical protein
MEARAVCVLFLLIYRKFKTRYFLVIVQQKSCLPWAGRLLDKEWTFLLLRRSKIFPGLMYIYVLYDILRSILIYF